MGTRSRMVNIPLKWQLITLIPVLELIYQDELFAAVVPRAPKSFLDIPAEV
jgi:hypothetical protein